jgi:hypothetical protein
MSVQKLTYTRAIKIYGSPYCNIPNPASFIVSGTNTSTLSNSLRDGSTNFVQQGVKVGDIVYNNTTFTGATVISIFDNNTLELNANIFLGSPESYSIYGGHQNTIQNQGCVLYIPEHESTILEFVTLGGDIVNNSFTDNLIPIQVIKLSSTSSANIYALW